jgi:hypothetical protein
MLFLLINCINLLITVNTIGIYAETRIIDSREYKTSTHSAYSKCYILLINFINLLITVNTIGIYAESRIIDSREYKTH